MYVCVYSILLSIVCTFIEKDAEIFPAHSTWKVAEKVFKIDFMMNKLAKVNFCENILEFFLPKNHCEIQVRIILECALYSLKYGRYI
jgi:hypothetical protein